MPKVLNTAEVEAYQTRGYHLPVDALSDDEVVTCRRQLEAYEVKTGGPIQGEMRHKSHLVFPWINDLMRHPRVLDAVEDILGPNLLVWSTSFFIKEARDPGFVSWHQDATYWGLSSPDVCTAWIALSPANKISGCMKFIPGTHKKQVEHADTFHEDNLLTRGQEIAVEVDESKAIYAELKPGQASLHHVLLFHGSAPNQSDDRRIGLAVRYVPTYVRQAVGAKDSATLVRGIDEHKNFASEPRPRVELDPEGLAFHRAATAAQAAVLYRGTDKTTFRP
ncbi:MAG: phytanoyl-CoA dioxygenase family protein [Hyphomicrobiaceae bacterium]